MRRAMPWCRGVLMILCLCGAVTVGAEPLSATVTDRRLGPPPIREGRLARRPSASGRWSVRDVVLAAADGYGSPEPGAVASVGSEDHHVEVRLGELLDRVDKAPGRQPPEDHA